jgi:malate dehydrogenase (oxaloacetate-decarboxylating)
MGWRHERIVGTEYEHFVDTFVDTVRRKFPGVLLQWEDFAQHHASSLLERHRNRLCSFNDDIQGTAAVALAAVLSGARQTGSTLATQRVVIVGAGSAGSGIGDMIARAMTADGLTQQAARRQIFLVDRDGLLHDAMTGLADFQRPLAQPADAVMNWASRAEGPVTLLDVIDNAQPTVLIGVSGQPGIFTNEVLEHMSRHVDRPIVLALSNPTSRVEATPTNIAKATHGRALVATGSPFAATAQANNVYVFPGLGLGVLAAEATEVTDAMIMAASHAVAAEAAGGELLPRLGAIREVSLAVADAVATAAARDGVSRHGADDMEHRVRALVREPCY